MLHFQHGSYQWTDGNPLVYEEWYNPNEHGPVPADLKAVISEIQQQPIPDKIYGCTIMFPKHGRKWARWAKIPCHYPLALSAFICKQPAFSADRDGSDNKIQIIEEQENLRSHISSFIDDDSELIMYPISCPVGWIYWEGLCVNMFSQSPSTNMLTWSDANLICKSKDAAIFTLYNNSDWFPALTSLLNRWKHYPQYGQIWISSNDTKLYKSTSGFAESHKLCPTLSVNRYSSSNTSLLLERVPCQFDSYGGYDKRSEEHEYPKGSLWVSPLRPRPWNVLCQKNVSQSERQKCKPFQFQCADRVCISVDSICDGTPDCLKGEDEHNCSCGFGFYRCDDKCISLSKYCDYQRDCDDGSDENDCVFPECSDSEYQCRNKECIPGKNRCDFVQNCLDGTDETECDWDKECPQGQNVSFGDSMSLYKTLGFNTITIAKGMRCYSGKCLPASRFRDLRADCGGPIAEDEFLTIAETVPGLVRIHAKDPNGPGGIGSYPNQIPFCQSSDSVRCLPSHTKCFKRQHTCIYDHNQLGDVASCRNVEHLKNCQDHECPGMVKCPNSYCIPHRKVCDGVWDCIGGFDEKNCKNYTCPGLFRCKDEKRCLDQFEVCDGVVHCKTSKDDENYCHYDKHPCPRNCTCFGNSINCSVSQYTKLPLISHQTRSLDISHSYLKLTPQSFLKLWYLVRLNVSNCGISELESGTFGHLYNLIELDLSKNNISLLVNGTFLYLANIRQLILHGNRIIQIAPGTFNGLYKLKNLDLSHQHLITLKGDTFAGLTSLLTLDLSKNSLFQIEEHSFRGLPLLHVLHIHGNNIRNIAKNGLFIGRLNNLSTDAYRFCCLSNATICSPEPDEFSSCDDLLANKTLQISIWILGAMALLGNVFVIFWRCVKEKSTHHSSLLIINLSISDFLMGVYLVIIATIDQLYRGVYIMYEEEWRTSIFCRLAGMIAMLSSEMSVFTMVVMTLDRVKAIIFPFKFPNVNLTSKSSLIICSCGWATCLVLSIAPMFDGQYFNSFYGQTGVCLPFTLRNIKNPGWEYAMFIFNILNGIAFIIIGGGYLLIYCSIRSSREASGRSFSDSDVRLLRNISLIIISDCLCWMPIIILSFMALNGVFIPAVVSAWVAVFILPLNSALNPFLYTFSSIKLACASSRKAKFDTQMTSM